MSQKKHITTTQPKYMPNWKNVGTQIRFGGKWLRKLGIEPDQQFEITYRDQQLILTPLTEKNGNQ